MNTSTPRPGRLIGRITAVLIAGTAAYLTLFVMRGNLIAQFQCAWMGLLLALGAKGRIEKIAAWLTAPQPREAYGERP